LILWLASYPRSGNTLCRLVMHSCFGVGSYSDQGNKSEREVIGAGEERGLLEFEGDWRDFYAKASASPHLHLVKTHQHPTDSQPAIVIMRDPRSALCSYYYYLQKHLKHDHFTLQQIISGDVYYGDWIEFYRVWLGRDEGTTLLVFFNELVDLHESTINRLAAFTGLEPKDHKPINFEALREASPAFFRSGKVGWQGDPAWTNEIEATFQSRFAFDTKKFG
jgi:hypothetical protein